MELCGDEGPEFRGEARVWCPAAVSHVRRPGSGEAAAQEPYRGERRGGCQVLFQGRAAGEAMPCLGRREERRGGAIFLW